MRETRSSGSVEGVMSNRDPYSDWPAMRKWSCCLCSLMRESSSKTVTTRFLKHPVLPLQVRYGESGRCPASTHKITRMLQVWGAVAISNENKPLFCAEKPSNHIP